MSRYRHGNQRVRFAHTQYEMVVLLEEGEDGLRPSEVCSSVFNNVWVLCAKLWRQHGLLQAVTGEDKIMYSDDPPMMFPEYQWERDSKWMVATVRLHSVCVHAGRI